MEIAKIVSKQSTCCRLKVGAVIVNNEKIISIGYNGVASKKEHCEDHFNKIFFEEKNWINSEKFNILHREFSRKNELHAELNCILGIEKDKLINSQLYITTSPCINCAKLIISSGIETIYFEEEYDREEGNEAIRFLLDNDITIIQIKNNRTMRFPKY